MSNLTVIVTLRNTYVQRWKEAMANSRFRTALVISSLSALLSIYLTGIWLCYNESRVGRVLHDPILDMFAPVDLSFQIFLITNVAVFLGLIAAMSLPFYTIRTMLCIIIISAFRMFTMYLFPLEPPVAIIPLRDPFLECTFYGDQVLLKDLFFSGHTSNLLLLTMIIPYRKMQLIMGVCTVMVGVMLILQHVHYTIDVIAAPFFVILAYHVADKIARKYYGDLPLL